MNYRLNQVRTSTYYIINIAQIVQTPGKGTAFVINSELMKGVITAVMWLKKADTAQKVFADYEIAIRWAKNQLINA